jgi:cellulose synthase operon protein C
MTYKHLAHVVLVASFAFGLTGCGKPNEQKLATRVGEYVAAGKTKDALIELRSYLQDHPQSARARFLLGQTLARSGNWAEAERELQRALDRGHTEAEVLPALVDAKLQQDKVADVIQSFGERKVKDPATAQKLRIQLVTAYLLKPELASAQRVLDEAMQAEADNPDLLVLRERLALAQGKDIVQIRQSAQTLAQRFAGHAEVQLLLGDTLASTDREATIAAYKRALAIAPLSARVHGALIGQYLLAGASDSARQQAERFYKAMPGNPSAVYYQGISAFEAGDHRMARDWLQLLLRAGDNNPNTLLVAGASELSLGNLSQAETHLNKAMQVAPEAIPPRYYLAVLQMRQGQAARALAALQPVLNKPDQPLPADVLALAAQAYSQLGDFKRADEAFQRTRALQPENPKARTDYARSLMARGDVQGGLRELREAASGKDSVEADLALAATLLTRKDFNGAMSALDLAVEKKPNTPTVDMLRARTLEAQGDKAGAKRAYELALRKDGRFLPAVEQLSVLDVRAGRADLAQERYSAVLARDPRSAYAMVVMADLARATGRGEADAAAWVEKAVVANPRDSQVWLAALTHQSQRGDEHLTLNWAQRAAAAVPDDAEVISRLAAAQLRVGDTEQAIVTMNRLVAAKPNVALLRVQAAQALTTAKKYSAARSHLARALELEPNLFAAQRANALLYTLENKPDLALAAARDQQAKHPQSSMGWWLVSEVHDRRGEAPASIETARKALALEPNSQNAMRVLDLMAIRGTPGQAVAFVQEWLKDHAQDAAFITSAAVVTERLGDPTTAQALHRKAVELNPENPIPLNNLAYFLVRSNSPESLVLAQRAVKMAPGAAAFRDTLARALAANGKNEKALEEQTRAVELAPKSNDFRLELARLYLDAGEKKKARTELLRLSNLGPKFTRQSEVQVLLKDAGG